MTNDEDAEDEMTDEADAEGEADVTGKIKGRSGSGRRAARSLQRARKLYEGSDWQPSTEADFRIQEAMVLALMDLADAVREQNASAIR